MTAIDYTPFVERMIERYEGGYGWDRGDSGGPTKFGITCYDLAQHRHERMDSMQRWAPIVRAMPLSEADDIYETKYAVQCCFNELGPGKDCVVFDFGVNSGSSRSIKHSQQIVGVHVDGILGPQTLAAINAYGPQKFINELCEDRLRFLRGLGIWSTFGRGWKSRVEDLNAYSLKLLPKPMAAGIMQKPHRERHEHKSTRILKAFAKGYHKEDLDALKAAHEQP